MDKFELTVRCMLALHALILWLWLVRHEWLRRRNPTATPKDVGVNSSWLSFAAVFMFWAAITSTDTRAYALEPPPINPEWHEDNLNESFVFLRGERTRGVVLTADQRRWIFSVIDRESKRVTRYLTIRQYCIGPFEVEIAPMPPELSGATSATTGDLPQRSM